jgi:plastocyanin
MNKLGQIVFVMAAATIVACGGGGGGGGGVDAPGSGAIDAPGSAAATVTTVDCASGSAAAVVTTNAGGNAYVSTPAGASSSDSAIKVDDIVMFMPASTHPVGPDATSGMTDPGLVAPDNATTCLKFSAVGTFHYKCTVHGFKGTVTVSAQ